MRKDCPFCSPRDIRFENELAFAIFDRNPVQKGHMLIIPRRHFADYFEATAAEVTACHELIRRARIQLDPEYHPDAYNIGINIGR
ncbi:MAG: HIT family protein, partial [Candidatus Krumholzibacteriota bacterium]|nr:HIT family protein [Candidatus Krumholzibacteriota bacterium]